MEKLSNIVKRISFKLLLIFAVGCIGMLLIVGVNYYLSVIADRNLSVNRISQEVFGLVQQMLKIEQQYVTDLNQDLLVSHQELKSSIIRKSKSIPEITTDVEINKLIRQVSDIEERHDRIFKDLGAVLTSLDKNRVQMVAQVAKIRDQLDTIISDIDTKETNLMMEGDEISSELRSVRNHTTVFKGFGNEMLLNVIESLLLFQNQETFLDKQEQGKKEIEKAISNTTIMIKASEDKAHAKIWAAVQVDMKTAQANEQEIYNQWLKKQELMPQLMETADKVQDDFQHISKLSEAHIEQSNKTGGLITLITAGLCISILSLLTFFVYRAIVGPISKTIKLAQEIQRGVFSHRLNSTQKDEIGQLATALDAMAEVLEHRGKIVSTIAKGDLTPEVDLASGDDQLGQSLQTMIGSLNHVLTQINGASNQVASGSDQVSVSSQALSQGATQQATFVEQITSSMTEMGSQTKTNAENASQANRLSLNAQQAADNGNHQMQNMIAAMNEISSSSQEIAKIIKTIDDIAFQTNLLALNAAVEAARAGKHGKGFAVVAQEVRNLAGRSAKAAQETEELIEGSVKRVENGTEIVNLTAKALSEIVDTSKKVTDLVGEIATSSNEQAQGIAQVNQGLSQIEQVTQQNTANAEETASAAEELSGMAAQLRQLVSNFKLQDMKQESVEVPIKQHVPTPKQLASASFHQDTWGDGEAVKPEDVISFDEGFGKY